jgi:hypothetical protein
MTNTNEAVAPEVVTEPKMLSIWFLVGLILVIYGLILLGCGVYYAVNPGAATTVLAELNPSLWWGGGVAGLGLMFVIFGR